MVSHGSIQPIHTVRFDMGCSILQPTTVPHKVYISDSLNGRSGMLAARFPYSLGLMAISALATADSTQVPKMGSVSGPLFSVPRSGSRMAVCLQYANGASGSS